MVKSITALALGSGGVALAAWLASGPWKEAEPSGEALVSHRGPRATLGFRVTQRKPGLAVICCRKLTRSQLHRYDRLWPFGISGEIRCGPEEWCGGVVVMCVYGIMSR